MAYVSTKEQKDIQFWVDEHIGEQAALVIQASAGSGKSTTICKIAGRFSPSTNWQMTTFGRFSVADLKAKMGGSDRIRSYNSFGFGGIRKTYPQVSFDEDKIDKIIAPRTSDKFLKYPVKKLIDMVKNNALFNPDDEMLRDIAVEYDIDLKEDQGYEYAEKVFEMTRYALSKSFELRSQVVDFGDQIWLPVFDDEIQMPKFDVLMADECLPYKTPIHLADGSWLQIGEIVDNQLSPKVLSYNTATGEQEACKIVGWSKTVNQKPMVKIRVAWSKKVGTNKIYSFVVCTTDHKIWTPDGYIQAGDIQPGMKVQVETAAFRSETYKITSAGRKVLTGETVKRNAKGFNRKTSNSKSSFMAIRGGNGKGMTEPQEILLNALGDGWTSEYVVPTKLAGGQDAGYPAAYKLDLANPERMIAVEVDGKSHKHRKDQDRKKDHCLNLLGWKVYRVENAEVFHNLDQIVEQILVDCPIEATVVSVEPTHTNERYVYDITVEGCHNFYANSILVHNCQDTNRAQGIMIAKSLGPDSVLIGVGDINQSIFAFRGADHTAMTRLAADFNADTLPLSISWRCSHAVAALVNEKFPYIKFSVPETALPGAVREIKLEKLTAEAVTGDMILCRVNAPLVPAAFRYIRQGIKATIQGRDIGKALVALIKKQKAWDIQTLFGKLSDFRQAQAAKFIAMDKYHKINELDDRIATIEALSEGASSIEEVISRAESLFSDEASGICLSSIHRAKGLEANNVYILRPDLLPHPRAKTPVALQQEDNLMYVSYTRSRNNLVFVHGKDE